MTYRKLFLFLFLTATLVLGAAWYLSLRTYYSAFVSSPAGACALDMNRGGIGIFYFPSETSWSHTFQSITDEERIGGPDEGTSPWGEFGMGIMPNRMPGSAPDRYVKFPVWFPYLIIVGSAYALTRTMEGRSARQLEKTLAAGGPPDGTISSRSV